MPTEEFKSDCDSNCAECKDAECKAIEIKTVHKIKWTKETKLAIRKIFEEIQNGTFEDDEDI